MARRAQATSGSLQSSYSKETKWTESVTQLFAFPVSCAPWKERLQILHLGVIYLPDLGFKGTAKATLSQGFNEFSCQWCSLLFILLFSHVWHVIKDSISLLQQTDRATASTSPQTKSSCPGFYLAPAIWSHGKLDKTDKTHIHEVNWRREQDRQGESCPHFSSMFAESYTPQPSHHKAPRSLPLLLYLWGQLRPGTAGERLPLGMRRKQGKVQRTRPVAWRSTRKENPSGKRPAEQQQKSPSQSIHKPTYSQDHLNSKDNTCHTNFNVNEGTKPGTIPF